VFFASRSRPPSSQAGKAADKRAHLQILYRETIVESMVYVGDYSVYGILHSLDITSLEHPKSVRDPFGSGGSAAVSQSCQQTFVTGTGLARRGPRLVGRYLWLVHGRVRHGGPGQGQGAPGRAWPGSRRDPVAAGSSPHRDARTPLLRQARPAGWMRLQQRPVRSSRSADMPVSQRSMPDSPRGQEIECSPWRSHGSER
jgi:hypothetical protein